MDEDAKTVLVSQIKAEQIPQGYTVERTGELKIQEIGGKECVLVTLKKDVYKRQAQGRSVHHPAAGTWVRRCGS